MDPAEFEAFRAQAEAACERFKEVACETDDEDVERGTRNMANAYEAVVEAFRSNTFRVC